MSGNGGKAYTYIPDYFMERVSTAHTLLCGNGDTNLGILLLSLVANRSMCGLPHVFQMHGLRHLGVNRPFRAYYLGPPAEPVRLDIEASWYMPALEPDVHRTTHLTNDFGEIE